MGEAVDTILSILNKCLFVSPDGQTDRPKPICLLNFFEVGGITTPPIRLDSLARMISYRESDVSKGQKLVTWLCICKHAYAICSDFQGFKNDNFRCKNVIFVLLLLKP